MKVNSLLLTLLLSIIYIPLIQSSCPLGEFVPVGPAVPTGVGPSSAAYSPLVMGNLFVAVANTNVGLPTGSISVYQVNTTTGVLTGVPGSPFTADLYSADIAYSPIFNGQLFAAAPNQFSNDISVYSVNVTSGVFTPVPGSPFTGYNGPSSIAYSPIVSNQLFAAVTNFNDNTVSVYQVNATTGAFSEIIGFGSPFTTGFQPQNVAYSPIVAGNLFAAVTNSGDNTVSVYQVNTTTGAFSPVTDSPFTTGVTPFDIAFSPLVSGNLFAAVTNNGDSTISVYQVNTTTGFFTPILPPVSSGDNLFGIAYSSLIGGNLFAAAANSDTNQLFVYQVDIKTGVFTSVTGSPFTTGSNPVDAAFSPLVPGGLFAAVPNSDDNTVSEFQVNVIVPTITTPSFCIVKGRSVTITATITGGTPPFTVVWNDGFTQVTDSFSVSRTVTPSVNSTYYIATVTDSNGCVAGPSNTVSFCVLCSFQS